ncbi:XPB/Ssl2-like helicase family protein [Melghirimyces profundicolus]|uniref:XPB/Ssl2-like helicase family protein n=1 Tax=Melghirimyces profundicolus TaxID=1242148 RepID=A0A2T6BQH2_9BACL|nr:helicase-associated domain-containing protein [Melghirimyces profundicolus]PTX58299.1 XPB/Ssl2-like helicase family protein [Melghirimyces profundicolus]
MKPSLVCCLNGLTDEARSRLSREHKCGKDPRSLAEAIVDEVEKDGFEGRLHPWERVALEFLVFTQGDRPIPEGETSGRPSVLSPSRFRTALVLLRRRGLLFRLRNRPAGWLLWCPREVRRAYSRSRIGEAPKEREVPEEIEDADPARGIWNPLFQFAVQLEREGIPLTREGNVPLTVERKLAVELNMDEESFSESRWERETGSPAVRLAAGFTKRLGILQKEGGRWVPRSNRLHRWLCLAWDARIEELFCLTRDFLLEDRPRWDGLWWQMERCQGGWFRFRETCLGWLALSGGAGKLPFFAEEVERRWLRPLQAMGWVERAKHRGETFWRWLPWAPPVGGDFPEMKGYVKPDFEILVPPFLPLHRRFLLALFADCMGEDQYITYELNADSVRRGAEKGISPEEMLQLLEEISGYPAPENVAVTLRRWAGDLPVLEEVWLLREPKACGRWVSEEDRTAWNLDPVGDGIYLVPSNRVKEVEKRLAEKGVSILQREEKDSWWEDLKEGERGEGEQEEVAPVDGRDPSPEEAVPGFQQLPKLWTSGMRRYHPSTLRELLNRAVSMELDVLHSSGKGEPDRFTPTKIVPDGEGWKVRGRDPSGKKRHLPMEAFAEVQLLAPWHDLI